MALSPRRRRALPLREFEAWRAGIEARDLLVGQTAPDTTGDGCQYIVKVDQVKTATPCTRNAYNMYRLLNTEEKQDVILTLHEC
jgi:hypothetical protein